MCVCVCVCVCEGGKCIITQRSSTESALLNSLVPHPSLGSNCRLTHEGDAGGRRQVGNKAHCRYLYLRSSQHSTMHVENNYILISYIAAHSSSIIFVGIGSSRIASLPRGLGTRLPHEQSLLLFSKIVGAGTDGLQLSSHVIVSNVTFHFTGEAHSTYLSLWDTA